MIADTIRQKFIYNVPFDNDENPLVVLDKNINITDFGVEAIFASELYFMENKKLQNTIIALKRKGAFAICIVNDVVFDSKNEVFNRGYNCYLLSFAYILKKAGFIINII